MEPLAHGIDYAWAQIPAPAIRDAGATFVVRYLGGSARLTSIEQRNLHAAGIAILLVWETAADGAEHPERGAGDARDANREADELGYPATCPIFYADDHNDGDVSQEADYMRNVLSVPGRPADLYSGRNVLGALNPLLAFGGWAVETWYRGTIADPCMVQLANTRDPIHIAGVPDDQFDTNQLWKPIPAWGPSGVVTLGGGVIEPAPPKETTAMIVCTPAYGGGAIALLLFGSTIAQWWTAKADDLVYGCPRAAATWNEKAGHHYDIRHIDTDALSRLLKANGLELADLTKEHA
jgi:hypothetical protein